MDSSFCVSTSRPCALYFQPPSSFLRAASCSTFITGWAHQGGCKYFFWGGLTGRRMKLDMRFWLCRGWVILYVRFPVLIERLSYCSEQILLGYGNSNNNTNSLAVHLYKNSSMHGRFQLITTDAIIPGQPVHIRCPRLEAPGVREVFLPTGCT